MRASLILLALASVLLPSCADLPSLSAGVCGNGVVDQGEDCDTFAPSGLACHPAGSTNECRFDCTATAEGKATPCPSGWGCGGDGVCREPTQKFKSSTAVVLASASEVRMGDFDGDGRQDVLTLGKPDVFDRREARVHFYEPDLSSARTYVTSAQVVDPKVVDANTDGMSDIVAGVGLFSGVTAFVGSRDRVLTPLTYPTFTIPQGNDIYAVVSDVLPTDKAGNHAGAEVLLLADFELPGGGRAKVLTANDLDPGKVMLALGDKGPAELSGDVKLGKLLETSTCDQLVFGFKGDSTVQVFAPCKKGPDGLPVYNDAKLGQSPDIAPVVITLPGPLAGPVFVADMNDDKHLDVLASLKGGKYAVAYGDGKMGFHDQPTGGGAQAASAVQIPRGIDQADVGDLVAVGDMNLDGLPDFVTGRGVFASLFATKKGLETLAGLSQSADADDACGILVDAQGTKSQVDCLLATNLGSPWTDALIADLNNDKVPDIVAGSTEAGVEFFNGTPFGIFNRFTIPTSGAAGRFSAGDFDGDLVVDVAFRELGIHGKAAGGSPIGDSLSVLFGRVASPPSAPVSMGRFERIEQLVAAQYFAAAISTTTDVGVISRSEDQKDERVSILAGSGDRQMLAPFGFQVVSPGNTQSITGAAFGYAPGDFDGDGQLDLAAAAFDRPQRNIDRPTVFRLWLAVGKGEGKLGDPRFSQPLPYVAPPSGGGDDVVPFLRTLLAAGDLDGDGKDEVVNVSPDGSGAAPSVLAVGRPQVSSEDNKFFLEVGQVEPLTLYASPTGQMALADLDGDGRLDMVVLAADTAPSATEGAAPTTHVAVYWNNGQGSFDTQNPLLLTPPSPSTAVRGFAVLTRGAGRDLVVATDAETIIATRSGRSFTFAAEAKLPRAESVWAGDVTGDGVEDLALLDAGTLRVFSGVPARR